MEHLIFEDDEALLFLNITMILNEFFPCFEKL
jgi:hypothetical protein